MRPIDAVLCPVDFSEASRRALRWASTVAHHHRADLAVLWVVEPLIAQAAAIELGREAADADANVALRDFVRAALPYESTRRVVVRTEVAVGEPAAVILETARRQNCGLIVMGTHGLGGVQRLLLGSTTKRVLRRTECPVLAVPAAAGPAPDAAKPSVMLERVLVATDFRKGGEAAVDWAGRLSDALGVSLVVVHVVEPVVVPRWWEPLLVETEDDRVRVAHRRLEAGCAAGRAQACLVRVGRPAEVIASLAAEYAAGLVVLGLSNTADHERHEPGTIAYRVLRSAHAAVVVVPRPVVGPGEDRGLQAEQVGARRAV